jgi:hypothetical protein
LEGFGFHHHLIWINGEDAMKRSEASLQALADREAIREALYRYCRAIDRQDAELGCSVFHEDAVADYSPIYNGSGRGFFDFSLGQMKGVNCRTHHQVGNVIIELNGDRAASEAYVRSAFRLFAGEKIMQSQAWARYVDQWSCRNGVWAIDKRLAITDFDEAMREVSTHDASSPGRRDRDDPSYTAMRARP